MTVAFTYLISRRLKNSVKSLTRSPARLIYAIFMLAMLGLVFFSGRSGGGGAPGMELRSLSELRFFLTLFLTLMFFLIANNGFNEGSSIFKMPDVTFLFSGPFSPRGVLFYGLAQQLATSLLMSFFILFQYSWLHSVYGIEISGLLLILAAYALMAFLGQLSSMLIYGFVSGSDRRRRLLRTVFYAAAGVFAAQLLLLAFSHRDNLFAAIPEAAAAAPLIRYFPVGGWLGSAVGGALGGEVSLALPGLLLTVLGLAAALAAVSVMDPDFYEDVIGQAEKAHSARAEAVSGKVREWTPKNVKVGASGLGNGAGADALYYKHRLENRRSRTLLFDRTSLLFAAVTLLYTYFMREAGGLISVLPFGFYMQFFSVSLGRFVKELTKPYIYLVPEPPMKKLLWSLRESLDTFLLDALVVAVPAGLILGLTPPEIAAFFLVRLTLSFLLLAANVACERVFGTVTVKALIVTFYILLAVVMAAPGIALAIFLGASGYIIVSLDFTICLAVAAMSIPVSLLTLYLCRNILDYAELNT